MGIVEADCTVSYRIQKTGSLPAWQVLHTPMVAELIHQVSLLSLSIRIGSGEQ